MDDHLSFIAGMGNMQIKEVKKWGVTTLELMAELTLPLVHKPDRGNVQTFEKLSHQARLQDQWRKINRPVFDILPLQEDLGFYKLPEPSDHDIFFDFEGDPYVGDTGLEYLFGWYYRDEYYDLWAHNDVEELQALEKFMDTVMDIWKQDEKMHIYHFGAYEQSALKRLVGKYATREDELDRLLRARVFVNLHTITRHSVIAGVESYSLKDLEKLHGYLRIRDLRLVVQKKVLYEGLLESGYINTIDEETIAVVRDYNQDDCISTKYLRDWLEELRQELVNEGNWIPRPAKEDDKPSENTAAHQQRIQPLFDELVKDIPLEKASGYPVVKKKLRQWYLRITEYADRLLEGLLAVDFSESMKEMQTNSVLSGRFVIMPNHIHIIWRMSVETERENLQRDFLKITAKQIIDIFQRNEPEMIRNITVNLKDRKLQVWKETR
jgi:uncharacterized protein